MAGAPQLIHPGTAARWSDFDLARAWRELARQCDERNLYSYAELPAVLFVNAQTLEFEVQRRGSQLSLF